MLGVSTKASQLNKRVCHDTRSVGFNQPGRASVIGKTIAILIRHRSGIGSALLAAALSGASASSAKAAALAGVNLPDTRQVAGVQLVLNGIALRTYSVLRIRVYVAGLYVEHRTKDAATILSSPETKLLEIHFLRDVGRAAARRTWRNGFAKNCDAPCRLTPQDIARFIAEVPAIHRGDISMFLFIRGTLTVTFDGRVLGATTHRYFAQQVLNTFLGPVPPTPGVKRELLGGG